MIRLIKAMMMMIFIYGGVHAKYDSEYYDIFKSQVNLSIAPVQYEGTKPSWFKEDEIRTMTVDIYKLKKQYKVSNIDGDLNNRFDLYYNAVLKNRASYIIIPTIKFTTKKTELLIEYVDLIDMTSYIDKLYTIDLKGTVGLKIALSNATERFEGIIKEIGLTAYTEATINFDELYKKAGGTAGERKTVTVNGITFALRYIPAGTFMMGSPSSEAGRYDKETQHKVMLTKGYWMMETEVTQELWQAVIGNNPSDFEGAKRPVEYVSWYDAIEFCNKLSVEAGLKPIYTIDKSSKDPNNENSNDDLKYTVTADFTANGYRLPTEAEWEYAAKGCPLSKGYKYAGGNDLNTVGWYEGNSGRKTHEVGTKATNELGLYDMSGNVWEWCWDWSGSYNSSSQTDPKGPLSGSYRVRRGGSCFSDAGHLRVAYRGNFDPVNGNLNLGFRLLRASN